MSSTISIAEFNWSKSERMVAVREAFIRAYAAKKRYDTALHCYECGHDCRTVPSSFGPTYPDWLPLKMCYHWTGFTFHSTCMPNDDAVLKQFLK